MAVQTQIQTRRGTAASWTSTNPTLAAGEIGFETDTGKFKIGNGSTAWAALAYSAGATAVTYLFNATSGQTTFSGADANGLTLAYTVGAEQVYLNGVLQVRGSDYTATNGTSIVLTSGALTSDVLNVIAYSAMTITDTYTQAQADAKFVQQTNNFFAGKNAIINGDFRINQRNFTSVTADDAYSFDRWKLNQDGGCTLSTQTFTTGSAPIAGYEGTNYARMLTTAQSASTNFAWLQQRIESVRTFAGQTVTVSFWAQAGSGTPKIAVELDQQFGSGGSTRVTTYAGQVTLSTSWARYSVTVAVPSISGKTVGTANDYLGLELWVSGGSAFNSRTGSLGIQNNTFNIWGVQLEAGSIATPFQTATGTLAGELAACQRYYTRWTGSASYPRFATKGVSVSATNVYFYVDHPVEMRVAPTAIEFSTLAAFNFTPNVYALSALILDNCNTKISSLYGTTSGMTSNQFMVLVGNNTSNGYLGLSAEL